MANKAKTTYEKFMENKTPKQREKYEREYQELVMSELLLALMDEDHVSVRELAKQIGISKTVIQDMRSGKRANTTLKNFRKIMHTLGAEIVVKKGRKVLATL